MAQMMINPHDADLREDRIMIFYRRIAFSRSTHADCYWEQDYHGGIVADIELNDIVILLEPLRAFAAMSFVVDSSDYIPNNYICCLSKFGLLTVGLHSFDKNWIVL